MAKIDDQPQEWSSTYVRTRAEMFGSALLILIVTFSSLDTAKWSWFGLPLQHAPSQGVVLLLLYGFYAYTVLSLVARAKIETDVAADALGRSDRLLRQAESLSHQLAALDLTAKAPDVKLLASGLEDVLKKWDGLKNRSDPLNAPLSALQDVIQHLESNDRREYEATTETIIAELGNDSRNALAVRHASMLASQVNRQINIKLTKLIVPLRQVYQSYAADATAGKIVAKHFNEFETYLSRIVSDLTRAQEKQNDEFTARMRAFEIELRTFRMTLSGVRNWSNFYRNLLSFWLPLSSSLALVLVSLISAWPDLVALVLDLIAQSPDASARFPS